MPLQKYAVGHPAITHGRFGRACCRYADPRAGAGCTDAGVPEHLTNDARNKQGKRNWALVGERRHASVKAISTRNARSVTHGFGAPFGPKSAHVLPP